MAFTLRLDEATEHRVRALAFINRTSIVDVVREAVGGYLDAHETPEMRKLAMSLRPASPPRAPVAGDTAPSRGG